MKVLMISGDRNALVPGTDAYNRAQLQREAVGDLEVVYWGRGSVHLPDASGFDVVTSQDPFFRGLVALIAARRAGTKLNIQVHADLAGHAWWKRCIARFVLRRADSVRVVSQRLKAFLESWHLRAPIAVLPVFIDIERFKNSEHKPHPRFTKVILWIGRFEAEKNPLQAIEILAEVRKAGVPAGLILLGKGSLEPALRARAQSLAEYIEFAGWQDPAAYLAMADVVVSTSRHESYGASIVEALAAGVAVVAPDVGVAREAGAVIVPRAELGAAAVHILRSGVRGHLNLSLLPRDAYAREVVRIYALG
ncbi:MAG TPA: glycosyltransferase [Candidatus Paceibacterota bacterium]|nr:glycosyltransferase [Candidatus Paceibacterota bacterium]